MLEYYSPIESERHGMKKVENCDEYNYKEHIL
jgi:hypothetical protein